MLAKIASRHTVIFFAIGGKTMGKDMKTNARPGVETGDAIADPALAEDVGAGAGRGLTLEEQTIADIKTTVVAVMDHVIALTTAVQAIAVGGRRPQNVRELDEAVTAARAYRKTL